jgi:hypothetical protein
MSSSSPFELVVTVTGVKVVRKFFYQQEALYAAFEYLKRGTGVPVHILRDGQEVMSYQSIMALFRKI